jgi:putative molybdopterin biosynthesis protein
MPIHSRLQEIRKARGFAAAELAERVGVSRQTIYAIEDGSFVPNTAVSLRLARALDVTVEQIFSIDEETSKPVSATLLAGDQDASNGQLVRLCRIGERLVAVPASFIPTYLPPSDGIVESKSGLTLSVKATADAPQSGNRLLLAGCDPALSLLNEMLSASGIEIVAVPCSSRTALQWLKRGQVHAAGSHLLDRATGDYNLPIINRMFPQGAVKVVTFAVWEQGLVLRLGNPKRIRTIAEVGRKDVTIMNREKGSGSRDLLDRGLCKAGVDPKRVKGYESIAHGHLAAAFAVASGAADCCIATRSAARCFGLHFIPLAVERFDLSFTKASVELAAAKALLDLLTRSTFRNKLQAIAGYETTHTGQLLV